MLDRLQEVREWAKAKIATGTEPPWAWYQYMKLIETVDAILAGAGAVTTTEHSQQSVPHQGKRLQVVDATYPQDNVQSRRGPPEKPQMPM